MSKHRIYDIAKELNTDNKTILDILHRNNIEAKTHSSTVDDAAKQLVADTLKKHSSQAAAKAQGNTAAVKPAADNVKENKVKTAGNSVGMQNNTQAKPKEHGSNAAENRTAAAKTNVSVQKKTGENIQHNQQQGQQKPVQQSGQQRQHNQQGERSKFRQEQQNRPQGQGNQGGQQERRFHNGNEQQRTRNDKQGAGRINGNNQQDNRAAGQRQNSNKNAGFQRRNISQGNQNATHQQKQHNQGNRPDMNERGGRNDRNDSRNNRVERTERMDKKDRNRQNSGHNDRNNKNNRGNFNNNQGFGGKNNRNRNNRNKNQQPVQKMEIARPKNIKVGETIVVKDLSSKMSCTAAEIIKKLMLMGVMASINQEIDFDTAALVASEFGVNCEELPPEVDPTLIPEIVDDPKTLVLRPPVVTVMGHVDHGKTSLLDVIRKTSVSTHEAGGITQHIGAYQVKCGGKKIVFLDTPGHEAFTAMRARGAQVTDIAVLVVAADDGVMPQTIEAIHHAKDAGVPIIVAVNKIDKPGANPANVKNELMEHGLIPEEYGGDTIMVEVSAKKNIGINDLLEMILLVAEVKELKANPKRAARGVIIEAQLDKGRGPVATVLVQSGTLRIGDSIVAGTTFGKVRAMLNDRGENVKKAGPSVPVEVLGLNDVPAAGDELAVLEEKQARTIAEKRLEKQRNEMIHAKSKVSLDDLFNQIQEGHLKDLNIVVKADVQGSVEALNSSLLGLNKNDEVRVRIVHSGVGAVTESDVMLASASNALVIAFNVRPDANARRVADTESIDIRTYRVIYDALNDVEEAMSGMLAPKFKEVLLGKVEIRQVMKFSKALVAGSYVLEGKITNQSKIRIVRDNIEIFDGELDGLRRFKDDVKEVAAGYECGITIKDFKDFREGDIIEAYIMEEVKTTINDVNKD